MPEPDDVSAAKQIDAQDTKAKDAVVQARLKGQTIRTARLEMTEDGGALVLDLVNSQVPCRIEWKDDGAVVFNFKNQRYVLRK